MSPSKASSVLRDHPLDPLSPEEIFLAANIVKVAYPEKKKLKFNVISLADPKKEEFLTWSTSPESAPKPAREVDIVALEMGVSGVWDGLVDLTNEKMVSFERLTGVQPILTIEDLAQVEGFIRTDPAVIEQCVISGVPADEMHKVYCDPWTIGYDERFGSDRRLHKRLCITVRMLMICNIHILLISAPSSTQNLMRSSQSTFLPFVVH